MSQVVGPFTIQDGVGPAVAQVAVAVAGMLPPGMTEGDPAGWVSVIPNKPLRAPSWAWGYQPSRGRIWVNPGLPTGRMAYILVHEYTHAWAYRHPQRYREMRALIVGPTGNTETANWTNDPDEGVADAMPRALGFNDGPGLSWARAYVPRASYGAMLAIAGKATARLRAI